MLGKVYPLNDEYRKIIKKTTLDNQYITYQYKHPIMHVHDTVIMISSAGHI